MQLHIYLTKQLQYIMSVGYRVYLICHVNTFDIFLGLSIKFLYLNSYTLRGFFPFFLVADLQESDC